MTVMFEATAAIDVEIDVPTAAVAVTAAKPGRPGLLRVKQPGANRIEGFSQCGLVSCERWDAALTAKLVRALRDSGLVTALHVGVPGDGSINGVIDVMHTNLILALQKLHRITAAEASNAAAAAGYQGGPLTSLLRRMHDPKDHGGNADNPNGLGGLRHWSGTDADRGPGAETAGVPR
jgi:hypothetical protein